MYGHPVKAEIIINRDIYAGSIGPKVRIIMEDGTILWFQQGNDGRPEILVFDRLTRAQMEDVLNARL